MSWDLKSDSPIYLQLIEQVKLRILSGVYPPGGKLPAVRDLAAEAAVNPNTMQKALAELERDGLVYSQRTAGRFITEDQGMIQNLKQDIAKEEAALFFRRMQAIGFSREEALSLLKNTGEGDAQ